MKKLTYCFVAAFCFMMATISCTDRLKNDQDLILMFFRHENKIKINKNHLYARQIQNYCDQELSRSRKALSDAQAYLPTTRTSAGRANVENQIKNLKQEIAKLEHIKNNLEIAPSDVVLLYDKDFKTGTKSGLMREYMRVRNNATHLDNEIKWWMGKERKAEIAKRRDAYRARIRWFEDRFPDLRKAFSDAYDEMIRTKPSRQYITQYYKF